MPVKAWYETVIIPTYLIGKAEKNPVFIEKCVYQGSSGKVEKFIVGYKDSYPTINQQKNIRPNAANYS